MKWKLRRIVDKAALILVSVKPIRWFFDQLIKFGNWASKNPFLSTIWKWYIKIERPAWISYLTYSLVADAWYHNIWCILIDIACLLVMIFLPNIDNHDNDEDNEPDEPDPTPNGDAVDLWIREQQKLTLPK
ncbi:MAG TPA: hypothetical protein VF974_00760 [Patescibacteria group bacterium]